MLTGLAQPGGNRTQGKGAVTTQETEPDPPARAGGSPTEAWGSRGSRWRGALAAAGLEGPWWEVLWEGATNRAMGPTDLRAGGFRLHNYHHMAESEEEPKSLLMRRKEESCKGLA